MDIKTKTKCIYRQGVNIVLVLTLLSLQGCAAITAGKHQQSNLGKLILDMNAKDVSRSLGRPDIVRVAKKLAGGKYYEQHEYHLYNTSCVRALSALLVFPVYPFCSTEKIWLHYVDHKLIFWGEKDNWQGAPESFGLLQ